MSAKQSEPVPIYCKKCGARVSSRAALPGHYRRAHHRRSLDLVPVTAKRETAPIRAEVVHAIPFPVRPGTIQGRVSDNVPSRSEIVPALRSVAPPQRSPRHILTDAEAPPPWWEPQADQGWRMDVWTRFPPEYRNRLLAARAGAAFIIRPPDVPDKVILSSQYHALKAHATRLDAGIGTDRERDAFEAGLREYDANYDRIRARRKS